MPGYLLDNNHVHAIFHEKPNVVKKLRSLPADSPTRVCTITLGEIAAGHKMNWPGNPEKRHEYEKDIVAKYHPWAIRVSVTTVPYYARIIGEIWNKHRPKGQEVRTEDHLVSLGVDINDVWIAAVAWEHGMKLVTRDKMKCIREAVPEPDTFFENWIDP